MKHFKSIVASILVTLAVAGCKTPTEIDRSYAGMTFDIECMGTDLDGSQTLRSWGTGKNKSQAMETAKKNAVRAVLFKGIHSGSGDCNKKPIILEVNAEEKYESYFNKFFADGGAYKNYTSMTDEKSTSRIKSANNSIETWGIVVRIDRSGLKQRMINDGIIKP